MHDDDDGQSDGDATPGASPFATSMRGAPWMRGAQAPWHMWGTIESLRLVIPVAGTSATAGQQLCRVNYKRPESWHWVFFARLLRATPLAAASLTFVRCRFNVTIGLGRASITLPNFETLGFTWDLPDPAPLNLPKWSTVANAGERFAGDTTPNLVEHLVAQDIQVNCDVDLGSSTPQEVTVEVGAFFAPKTHVRPDWLLVDVSAEEQFPGEETGGK